MKLTIFGTGNAMVTKCYNTCFCVDDSKGLFLVDAGGGNGILQRLEQTGIKVNQLHDFFLTHGHTDHVLGGVWMVRAVATAMNKGQYEGEFRIYGHREVIDILEQICRLTLGKKFLKHIGDDIVLHVVENGENREICGAKVTFFDICSTKMKQFGFRMELPDGQILCCLGDEPYNENCKDYAANCDWLLSEAFCLYEDREHFKPYEKHHSTALDAGRLAEQLGVKNLVLYHTEDSDLEHRKSRYGAEAQTEFHGRVYVPDDLEVILLDKGE